MPTPITASTLSALLSAALAQKPTRPLVLALDGRCGSGKTTLANGLAAQLPGCTLLRTDDFYLPPAQRIPDWAHTPCANMDLTRLRDEALRLAYAGQTVAYRAYSCREADFSARWVPLEEGYFAQYGIEISADFVVETTQGGTI